MRQNGSFPIHIDFLLCNAAVYRIKEDEIYFEDFNLLAETTEKLDKTALIGKKLIDVFPGAKAFGLYDVLWRVYRTGKSESFELKFYEDDRISGWRENYISKLEEEDLVLAVYRDLTEQKQLEEENSRTLYVLDIAQEVAKLGSWDWDIRRNTLWFSEHVGSLFGAKGTDALQNFKAFFRMVHPDDRSIVSKTLRLALKELKSFNNDIRIIRPNGEELVVNIISKVFLDEKHKSVRMIGTMQDVTQERLNAEQITALNHALVEQFELAIQEKMKAEKKEREAERHFALINRYVMISETDLAGSITHVSQAFCDVTGYTQEELIGQNHRIIRCKELDDSVYKAMWQTISSKKTWEGELKSRSKEGVPFWTNVTISPKYNEKGKHIGYTAIRQNITAKKMFEAFSIQDGLTNLFNRRHFDDMLANLLNSAKREEAMIFIAMFDVDYFKKYNDFYGHSAGDEVLIKIARAMQARFKRSGDYCFRVGGEEFCIVSTSKEEMPFFALAKQLKDDIEALKIPHQDNTASPYVTVSIGALSKEAHSVSDAKALYQEVDALLYRAKEKGRNQIVYM